MKKHSMIDENFLNEDDDNKTFDGLNYDFKRIAEVQKEEALIGFIVAILDKNLVACRESLVAYFEYVSPTEIQSRNLSTVSFQCVIQLFKILVNTGLDNAPEGTPAQLLFQQICEQVINRIHKKSGDELAKELNGSAPDKYVLFPRPIHCSEDSNSCLPLFEVAQVLGADENEFIQAIDGAGLTNWPVM